MIYLRTLHTDEINRTLFRAFIRRQVVTKCWRKVQGEWVIQDAPFIDDWSEADYQTLMECLRNTLQTGGLVYGAFKDDSLKGFVSVEGVPLAENSAYWDLTSLHVSEDCRGQGIGTRLFTAAKAWAKKQGATWLYISAHSAVESQRFYHKMGCQQAQICSRQHVQAEPFDCQLECKL